MTTVSTNSPSVSSGVMTIGSAVSAVMLHDDRPDAGRDREADHGAEQRLPDDDLVDVAPDEPMARSVANSLRWSLVLE